MEKISGRFARDFLGRLSAGTSLLEVCPLKAPATSAAGDNDSGKIELSLGLSLNGCFGIDPKEKQNGICNGALVRSSSIASPSMFQEHELMALTRTCSLPTVTEVDLRKTKELQCLKRLEAKRKRIERKTSLKSDDISSAATAVMPPKRTKSGRIEFELNGCSPVSPGVIQLQFNKFANGYTPAVGVPAWATGAGLGKIASQRSIGSQGSVGSSGITELDNQPLQEEWSPPVMQPHPDHPNQKMSESPLHSASAKPTVSRENTSRRNVTGPSSRRDMERNVMEEMPCVTTKAKGPNGKRIEGFLYRYKKGEEIRIVCVCHGDFLTPAEFVRHAGGGDVDHPLRHIVVCPASAAFS